ncbi:pectinesterase inhibitor-like [Henckelia pumila]|uniref:pectinesterase inhibitor-like n=1 Tax=Henckelia pumila TaxID=405737 RepID=UPI003C6E9F30
MANLIGIISLISIILMFAIPASSTRHQHKKEKDGELRDLCSKTHDPDLCWKLLKSERSKFHTDTKGVVEVSIDLAKEKAKETKDKLSRLGEESKNEKLKVKYFSCKKNYDDAIRDLNEAKEKLRKKEYYSGMIPVLVDDVIDEVKSCNNDFDNGAYDPARIQKMNVEFGVYVDLVKVAVDCLLKEKRDR